MIDRLKHYIRVAGRTPLQVLFSMLVLRAKNKIWDFFLYRKVKKYGADLSDNRFVSELKLRGAPGLQREEIPGQLADLDFLETIFSENDRKFIVSDIPEGTRKEIIDLADEACSHIFDLLGSGKTKVSYSSNPKGVENHKYLEKIEDREHREIKAKIDNMVNRLWPEQGKEANAGYVPIDWHRDFKSGFRWDKTVWFKNIEYGNTPGADIKVPWEISRCQHLITLGQAYALTGDEKYSKEYVYQLIDWIENNKVQFGANWRCTMDVSIRAANWVISMAYFKDSIFLTREFKFYLIKNIYCHGKHIMDNLEFGSITSNHYLSDIAGLFFIALLLKKHHIGKKWLKFSIAELKSEMKKQVYDDGVDFEASTCYHRLVLELFFYPVFYYIKGLQGRSNETPKNTGEKYFGKDFISKLYGLFDFIIYALKPDGRIPQIGDNDNGRFLIFGNSEVLDLRYLLTFAAIFFEDPKFKIEEHGFSRESLWVFGQKGSRAWDTLEGSSLSGIGSRAFKDSGFYIMRNKKDYLIVSCGPNGQKGNGGHAHNDKLGFELMSDGESIIIDPGTYVYTPAPEWRNKLRSTAFHNTIAVDSHEQNRFKENDLFSLENDARVSVNSWKSASGYDFLDMEHYGYKRLKDPVVHRRQILYDRTDKLWLIKDILSGNQKHSFALYFHILCGMAVKIDNKSLIANIRSGKGNDFYIIPYKTDSLDLMIREGSYSSGYGNKERSKIIEYSQSISGNAEFIFLLVPDDPKKDISIYLNKLKYIVDET